LRAARRLLQPPSHDWQSSRAHGGGRWHRRVGWRVDRRRKGRGGWRGNWWSRRLYLSPAESQKLKGSLIQPLIEKADPNPRSHLRAVGDQRPSAFIITPT